MVPKPSEPVTGTSTLNVLMNDGTVAQFTIKVSIETPSTNKITYRAYAYAGYIFIHFNWNITGRGIDATVNITANCELADYTVLNIDEGLNDSNNNEVNFTNGTNNSKLSFTMSKSDNDRRQTSTAVIYTRLQKTEITVEDGYPSVLPILKKF